MNQMEAWIRTLHGFSEEEELAKKPEGPVRAIQATVQRRLGCDACANQVGIGYTPWCSQTKEVEGAYWCQHYREPFGNAFVLVVGGICPNFVLDPENADENLEDLDYRELWQWVMALDGIGIGILTHLGDEEVGE